MSFPTSGIQKTITGNSAPANTPIHCIKVGDDDIEQQKNTATVRQLETKMRQLESRIRQVETLHAKAEARLAEIYSGRSWRITRPLRWLSAQVAVLKKEGIWTRCVKFPKKLMRIFLHSQANTEKAQQTKLSQQLAQLSPMEMTIYRALKTGLTAKNSNLKHNTKQQGSSNKEALE